MDNPAASHMVHIYVKPLREEQYKVHGTPKQAIPLCVDKLTLMALYIDHNLQGQAAPRSRRANICFGYRDQTLFKLLFLVGTGLMI